MKKIKCEVTDCNNIAECLFQDENGDKIHVCPRCFWAAASLAARFPPQREL